MNQARSPNGYSDFTMIDGKGTGGKTLVMHHMKSHYDRIVAPKPSVNTAAPKKYIHENKKPVHLEKNKRIDPNLEMRVAFRKVANMTKGYTDHSAPVSVKEGMKNRLKGRYEKEKKNELMEHKLNLESMNKKLEKKTVPQQERMKNTNDPVAHPVRFFRRNKELPHKKVEYLMADNNASRLVITNKDASLKERFDTGSGAFAKGYRGDTPSSAQLVSRGGQGGATGGRTGTAGGFQYEAETGVNSVPMNAKSASALNRKDAEKLSRIFIQENLAMPELKGNPQGANLLERRLLDIIVNHSLYKDEQLSCLFDEFVKANKNLNQEMVMEAITRTKKTLDE